MRTHRSYPGTVVLCGAVAVLASATPACQPAGNRQITAELAAQIESVYLEARNTPNLELLDGIYAEDVVVHGSSGPDILGLEALKADYQISHTGFPDFRMHIDEAFWTEDRIVLLWTVEGTHTGDLLGVPPTNRSVTLSGVAIDRVEAGLIVEEWVYFNLLDLLEQIGMQVGPGQGMADDEMG